MNFFLICREFANVLTEKIKKNLSNFLAANLSYCKCCSLILKVLNNFLIKKGVLLKSCITPIRWNPAHAIT